MTLFPVRMPLGPLPQSEAILQKDDETRPDYKQGFEMRVYFVNDNFYYSLMTGFFVFSFPDVALRD